MVSNLRSVRDARRFLHSLPSRQPSHLFFSNPVRPLKLIRSDSRSASTLISDRIEIGLTTASSSDLKHLRLTCHLLLVLSKTPL
jgi:hypothetical protein